jgi:peptidylprolyl isomerase
MKMLAVGLLALGLVLGACGSDDNNKTTGTPKPTVASQGVQPRTGSPSADAPTRIVPVSTPTTVAPTSPQPLSDGNAPGIPPLTGEIKTDGNLRYIDEKVGDGATPQSGQRLTVHYTGWLTDGTKFDSSVDRGQPYQFVLGAGRVIPGWDKGLATMKVGGKRRLILPPELGYGARGSAPRIPPNATLIFDVELLAAQQ